MAVISLTLLIPIIDLSFHYIPGLGPRLGFGLGFELVRVRARVWAKLRVRVRVMVLKCLSFHKGVL